MVSLFLLHSSFKPFTHYVVKYCLNFRLEVRRPLPGGDGKVDLGLLRRHAHHLAATPSDRADIAVDHVGRLAGGDGGGVDLFARLVSRHLGQFIAGNLKQNFFHRRLAQLAFKIVQRPLYFEQQIIQHALG